jgi:hypothetical protein
MVHVRLIKVSCGVAWLCTPPPAKQIDDEQEQADHNHRGNGKD